MLDGAGQVGCEVGKDPLGIAKIKAPGDILRRIVEDHGQVDRERAEHLVQMISTVLEVDGVGINGIVRGGYPARAATNSACAPRKGLADGLALAPVINAANWG